MNINSLYISYSTKDAETANLLSQGLIRMKFTVTNSDDINDLLLFTSTHRFYDAKATELYAMLRYRHGLSSPEKATDAYIILATEAYLSDSSCAREYNMIRKTSDFANENNAPIIIIAEDAEVLPNYMSTTASAIIKTNRITLGVATDIRYVIRSLQSREASDVSDYRKNGNQSLNPNNKFSANATRSVNASYLENAANQATSLSKEQFRTEGKLLKLDNSRKTEQTKAQPTSFPKEKVYTGDKLRENDSNRKAEQVKALRKAYQEGNLCLVLGAGVSKSADIPEWGGLLKSMLRDGVEQYTQKKPSDKDVKQLLDFLPSSNLIIGKYLELLLGDKFKDKIYECLYMGEPKPSELMKSIANLAKPKRKGQAIESIITYNFDSMIEQTLGDNIEHKVICCSTENEQVDKLPIYHVHGYIPQDRSIEDSVIVFSEDAYHEQFMEPYSWANLTQLYKFSHSTCLFIGISLTDPNMRRLLDIAKKRLGGPLTRSHYIFMQRPSSKTELQEILTSIAEQDANALGLNVIWYDEREHIPAYINSIKD